MKPIRTSILLILLLCSLVSKAQTNSVNDSICRELRLANYKQPISAEQFDSLCQCLNNGILLYENVASKSIVSENIEPLKNTYPTVYGTYRGQKLEWLCNGYYSIFLTKSVTKLFGVNSELKGLNMYLLFYDTKVIKAGFKNGLPEAKWIYIYYCRKKITFIPHLSLHTILSSQLSIALFKKELTISLLPTSSIKPDTPTSRSTGFPSFCPIRCP